MEEMMNAKLSAYGLNWRVIPLLLLVFVLFGCQSESASDADVVEPEAATAEPTAVVEEPTTVPEPTQEPEGMLIDSAEKITGIWLGNLAGETGYVMYTPDGQFSVSLTEQELTTAPRVFGEYWFENGQIHMRDLENAGHWAACDAADVGIYDVVVADDDTVTFQTVEDPCNEGGFTRQYLFANMVQERIGEALPMALMEQAEEMAGSADPAHEELAATLQAILDGYVVGDAGAVLMIDAPDMGFSWKGAGGMADPESELAMSADDQFIISSGTKMYTAIVILKLVEQGKLALDDPISTVLPEELVAQLLVIEDESFGETITLRQLLNHTSGLGDFSNGVDANNNQVSDFKELVLSEPNTIWTPDAVLAWAVENAEPVGMPGETFNYSDTNYQLLGLIIENVTGMSLAEAYRQMIFDPAGMAHTYFEFNEPIVPGVDGRTLSHASFAGIDWSENDSRSYEFGSGGIVSTVEDQTHFLQAWVNGELFDDPATSEAMLDWGETADAGSYYGLGILRFVFDEWGIPGLGEVQGHSGLFNSQAFYWPEQNVTIVGTLNSREPEFGFIGLQIDALTALQAFASE
jgi:D-alanyl-D-alanine carboxypeptidase